MGHGRRLVFEVGGHLFAVEVSRVREALDLPPTTPLPGTPEWVLGLAHVRGHLFAVVDFSGFLGLSTAAAAAAAVSDTGQASAARGSRRDQAGAAEGAVTDEEAPPCLVVEHAGRRLGIVVSKLRDVSDSVEEASEVSREHELPVEIQPYVAAVAKFEDDRPLLHLNVARLFADVYA
ncbi:MAG: chemotaxis protein CheW [Gemmatimonadetes bacterium]|nr:chemotaxis protein CheW [Gemmatimonadota bacterium]